VMRFTHANYIGSFNSTQRTLALCCDPHSVDHRIRPLCVAFRTRTISALLLILFFLP